MAKRSRGSARPGQRRPGHRPGRPASAPTRATPASPARRPDSLTDTELARAEELEAQLVAEERAADDARRRTRGRARVEDDLPRTRREASVIGARAAEEYAYVVRDVRRIAVVGGSLLAILAALYIVIEVLGLVRI